MRAAFPSLAAAAVAVGLLHPHPARAQAIPSPYSYVEGRQEVGIFSGYMSAATGRFGYGPSGGTVLGARYGLELTGPLSLEIVAGTVSGTRDIINPGRAEGDRVIGKGDSRLTTVDGRLKFSATGDRAWHRLSPFLVFGGGIVFDIAETPAAEASLEEADVFEFGKSFLGTLGVGTRWFVSRKFALRTDATFSLWKIETPVGFSDPLRGFAAVEEGEWVRGLSISASLLYRW